MMNTIIAQLSEHGASQDEVLTVNAFLTVAGELVERDVADSAKSDMN
ncbi:hypothetical protein ACXX82_21460 [Glaciimonas sp. GNP009]|nr:hypothetical protein [Glaciimonas sp. Cout2]MEB0010252.1 hypothetical protein [Glaciimonas sp. Cout2]